MSVLSWFKSLGRKSGTEQETSLEKFGLPFNDDDVEYYCRYDWLPSVVTILKDGSKDAFSLTEKGWIRQSPGELSMQAALISREDFYGWLQGYGHVYDKAEERKRFLEESARIRAQHKILSVMERAPFKESEVTSYVNWEGRLAVIVGDSESSLDWPKPPAGVSMRPPLPGSSAAKGFFLRDGEWLSAEVIEIADSGTVIPRAEFQDWLANR